MVCKCFLEWQIVDFCKLKEFADDNLKFNENGRMFSKQVENTVGKGEIARYEQFLLFPQCFQKTDVLQTHTNKGLFWKGLKVNLIILASQNSPPANPFNLDKSKMFFLAC